MDNILFGLAWYVVFVFSVTLHEAAHAFAAKILGDPTAYYGGQVTIDPIPHIKREPFGMVILPIITVLITGWPIGFAHAPYDPYWAYNHPKRAAWMAFAGPASNFIVAVVAAILLIILMKSGVLIPKFQGVEIFAVNPDLSISGIGVILSMMFFMNLVLAVLNIFPLPPLDGSSVISLFMKDSTARSYMEFISQPTFGIIGMLVVWQIFDKVFPPVFIFFLKQMYSMVL